LKALATKQTPRAVRTSEEGGKFLVTLDESALGDLLAEEDFEGIDLVKTIEFETGGGALVLPPAAFRATRGQLSSLADRFHKRSQREGCMSYLPECVRPCRGWMATAADVEILRLRLGSGERPGKLSAGEFPWRAGDPRAKGQPRSRAGGLLVRRARTQGAGR
jgi:hypothetical protein